MSVLDIAFEFERQRAARADINPYGLTSREKQIARHLLAGSGHQDIAARLNIASKTVRGHQRKIMSKLRARSFEHLMVILSTLPGVRICKAEVTHIEDFRRDFGRPRAGLNSLAAPALSQRHGA